VIIILNESVCITSFEWCGRLGV